MSIQRYEIHAYMIDDGEENVAAVLIAEADGSLVTYDDHVRYAAAHDDLLAACEAIVHAVKMNDPALGAVAATLAEAAVARAKEINP